MPRCLALACQGRAMNNAPRTRRDEIAFRMALILSLRYDLCIEERMNTTEQFRDLLRQDGMIVAPGAYDCITARLIEQAGFQAVYMTGAGTAATLGYPDYGLVTMSEMADNAGRIAAAVRVPVIADADTGYGNALNATRTVRKYERRFRLHRCLAPAMTSPSPCVEGVDQPSPGPQ